MMDSFNLRDDQAESRIPAPPSAQANAAGRPSSAAASAAPAGPSRRALPFSIIILLGLLVVAFCLRWTDWPLEAVPDSEFNLKRARVLIEGNFTEKPSGFEDAHIVWKQQFYFMHVAGVVRLAAWWQGVTEIDDAYIYAVAVPFKAVIGALILVPIWLAARRLHRGYAALIAPLAAALAPGHVQTSANYQAVDTLAVLYLAVSVYFALRALRSGAMTSTFASACFVAMAAGCRFSFGLAALAVYLLVLLCALKRYPGGTARRAKRVLMRTAGQSAIVTLLMAAVFLAGNPILVAQYRLVATAFMGILQHMTTGHYGFDVLPGMAFPLQKGAYQLFAMLPFYYGFPLYASLWASVLALLPRIRRNLSLSGVLVSFILLPFGAACASTVVGIRYVEPLLPFAALLAMAGYVRWVAWAPRLTKSLLAVCTAYTAVMSATISYSMSHDTRVDFSEDFPRVVPRGSVVASYHARFPYRYKFYMGEHLQPAAATYPPVLAVELSPLNRRADLLAAEFPDYLVTSSFYTHRWIRAGEHILYASMGRDELEYYTLEKRYSRTYLNRELYERLDPMFRGYFFSPDIYLYRLKDALARRKEDMRTLLRTVPPRRQLAVLLTNDEGNTDSTSTPATTEASGVLESRWVQPSRLPRIQEASEGDWFVRVQGSQLTQQIVAAPDMVLADSSGVRGSFEVHSGNDRENLGAGLSLMVTAGRTTTSDSDSPEEQAVVTSSAGSTLASSAPSGQQTEDNYRLTVHFLRSRVDFRWEHAADASQEQTWRLPVAPEGRRDISLTFVCGRLALFCNGDCLLTVPVSASEVTLSAFRLGTGTEFGSREMAQQDRGKRIDAMLRWSLPEAFVFDQPPPLLTTTYKLNPPTWRGP